MSQNDPFCPAGKGFGTTSPQKWRKTIPGIGLVMKSEHRKAHFTILRCLKTVAVKPVFPKAVFSLKRVYLRPHFQVVENVSHSLYCDRFTAKTLCLRTKLSLEAAPFFNFDLLGP